MLCSLRGSLIVAALAVGVVVVLYPTPYPDRLAKIDEAASAIDNAYYDLPEWARTWYNADGSGLADLRRPNGARIPYFERIWRRELGGTGGRFGDIGCGGGIATNALAARGFALTGWDISPNSLAAARAAAAAALPGDRRPTFVDGSAYAVPAADASLDGVVMSDVLEHFHDLRRAAAEAWRVLKPGGVLVFDTINRTPFSYAFLILLMQHVLGRIPRGSHDWRLFITPAEVADLLNATGFDVGPRADLVGMHPDGFGADAPWVEDAGDLAGLYLWWARKPRNERA